MWHAILLDDDWHWLFGTANDSDFVVYCILYEMSFFQCAEPIEVWTYALKNHIADVKWLIY